MNDFNYIESIFGDLREEVERIAYCTVTRRLELKYVAHIFTYYNLCIYNIA